jgi:hypothetical protein
MGALDTILREEAKDGRHHVLPVHLLRIACDIASGMHHLTSNQVIRVVHRTTPLALLPQGCRCRFGFRARWMGWRRQVTWLHGMCWFSADRMTASLRRFPTSVRDCRVVGGRMAGWRAVAGFGHHGIAGLARTMEQHSDVYGYQGMNELPWRVRWHRLAARSLVAFFSPHQSANVSARSCTVVDCAGGVAPIR